jgi:hypothetical protein
VAFIHNSQGDEAMPKNVNRRAILAGAAALPSISAATTNAADARADTPLLEMERQLTKYDALIPTLPPDKECDEVCRQRNELAMRIFDTQAQGLQGLAVQARVFVVERQNEINSGDYSELPLDAERTGHELAQGILRLAEAYGVMAGAREGG